MTASQVQAVVDKSKAAAKIWKSSSFKQRKHLLRVILKYILENQEEICLISSADSGKPMVDAAFGEIIVTCEKICWLINEGEQWLKPERRSTSRMMFYKKAQVEYHPVGVVGAIVAWNYPFHNLFNPLTAAIFAGNGCVIKPSEHSAWSARKFASVIDAALEAAGAPVGLVQIVTGYSEAGEALVQSGLGKLIFVGSTGVGKKVMQAASATLTPVVLELGGKDAFIVCEDAKVDAVLPTALRGAFQSCGQNCAGAERFFVHESLYEEFCRKAAAAATAMRQGHALGDAHVDSGAICMPGLAEKVQRLVDDAVKKGARVLAGGRLPKGQYSYGSGSGGQFYPATVLVDVAPGMKIWEEETFGPVFAVTSYKTDEEAIQLANDCPFGLASSVFSSSTSRARKIGSQLEAGMTSINDFAATYMCQSLPFGGVKDSGFDRFAGVEGLRGLCVPKAVVEDRWPFSTSIPPLLQYPVNEKAFGFVSNLVWMFYAPGLNGKAKGLLGLAKCFLPFGGSDAKTKKKLV